MISVAPRPQYRFAALICGVLALSALSTSGCAETIDTPEEFIELGHRHERDSELPEAVSAYRKALALNDKLPTAWYDLGVAFAAMEQFPEAINAYSKAIELDPSMAQALNNRAAVHARLRQFDRAIADCDQAIDLTPRDALAWRNRGLARHDRGDLEKAVADYDESIRIDGRAAEAYHGRGNVFLERRQWSRALEDFDQAIHLDEKMSAAWLSRAIATARLGRLQEADQARQKAAELGAMVDDVVLAELAPRLDAAVVATDLVQQAVQFVLGQLSDGEHKLERTDAPWDLFSGAGNTRRLYVVRVLAREGNEEGIRFTTAELDEFKKAEGSTTLVIVESLNPTESEPNQPQFRIAKSFEDWKPDLSGMRPVAWLLPMPPPAASAKTDSPVTTLP